MHRLSGCPSCAEPLEEGDRFCGVCGYALSAPPPSGDHPTLPLPQGPPTAAPPAAAPAPPAAGGAAGGGPGGGGWVGGSPGGGGAERAV
ncbi:zinc-ribbon domain-containing protein, partial [Streptomyces goshikiensis]